VRHSFAKRPIGRRIIALVAAYAVALESLIASFGAAQAAAASAADPGAIICHALAGQSSPTNSGDETNSKICADSCCIGCLTLMAALPPPPAGAIAMAQSSGQILPQPAAIGLAGDPQAKSYQSRAPPLNA
jgi:hypothetical protein